MPKEDYLKLPFKEQLKHMPRVELYRIMSNCSRYDEDDVIRTTLELGIRYEEQGMTPRERKLLTLFACSTDEKQYSLGVDMLTEFVPRKECEQYMIAVYQLAGREEGKVKSIPRIKSALYLMRVRPEEELEQVISKLSDEHSEFIQMMSELRDKSMISEPTS